MVDAVALVATAQRLIQENGRSVTFISHDQTLDDAAKPWQGATTGPRTTPDDSFITDAVFVEPSAAARLGLSSEQSDLIKRSDQIMIVSPGTGIDLNDFEEVLDETVYWKITGIEILRPGTTTFLAFIGVKR